MFATPRSVATLAVVAALFLLAAGPAQAAPKPDMKPRGVSQAPSSLAPGDTFSIEGQVRNKGTAAAPAEVSATLSTEATPEPGAVELGSVTVNRVAADAQRGFSLTATVPGTTADGTYYQVVCVPRRGTTGTPVCRVDPDAIAVATPNFQPGARTLGDPLFPQTGNGGYDVTHYDLELDYDPVTNTFEPGTRAIITAQATQDLSEFSLDFQDLPISAVTVDGAAATFTQVDAEPPLSDITAVTQPMKLVVTPAGGIRDGDEFDLVVEYTGEPRVITDADESIEGWIPACYPSTAGPEVCDGGFTVNQPNGSQGWFPGNHYPTDKATFDTSVTVPIGKVAFGMGELISRVQDAGEGEETWNWSSNDPAASYLATATNGDFLYEEGSIPEVWTGRSVSTYHGIDASAPADQVASARASIRRMRGQLNFLSERVLGPYPFDSMGVVADRVAGVGYALENQTKAHFAGPFAGTGVSVSVTTLLHEVAHQWMGNSVSIETWPDLWFNEGWATWLTWYWAYEDNSSTTSPPQQFATNYANATAADWEQAPALLDEPAELFHTFPVYTRGAMILEGYRQIVGDEPFFAFSKKLASQYADDNISTEEFIDFALAESGLSGEDLDLLDDYFQEWLYGSTQPQILPEDFEN